MAHQVLLRPERESAAVVALLRTIRKWIEMNMLLSFPVQTERTIEAFERTLDRFSDALEVWWSYSDSLHIISLRLWLPRNRITRLNAAVIVLLERRTGMELSKFIRRRMPLEISVWKELSITWIPSKMRSWTGQCATRTIFKQTSGTLKFRYVSLKSYETFHSFSICQLGRLEDRSMISGTIRGYIDHTWYCCQYYTGSWDELRF